MKRGWYEKTIDGIVILPSRLKKKVEPKRKKKCKTDKEIDEIVATYCEDLKEEIMKLIDTKIKKLKEDYYE